MPRFVERELREFLDCGIPAHGVLRVHCDACGEDRLVAFSCKARGFCPSCGGRRMADTAAHLVDRVLPESPVRQWVLSLPFALRYLLAYDARLLGAVLRVFVRAVFASTRRRARLRQVKGPIRCGAVTFVQRFGGAVNLSVHFHTLALDGVYVDCGRDAPGFHADPPPDDAEVARVTRRVAPSASSRSPSLVTRVPDPRPSTTRPAVSGRSREGSQPNLGRRLCSPRDSCAHGLVFAVSSGGQEP